MDRISERGWLGLVVLLAAVAGAVSTWTGFAAPLTIQDDARQFVFWMAEWRNQDLFAGDLVADYWRSVTPWLFASFYRAFDFLGIVPVTTARLLPVILFPLTALFAFRFARAISPDPRVACLGALFLMLALVSSDSVVSATPRAFAPLFFLIFLDGLARRTMVQMAIGLFCLAGFYPIVAVVAATALGIALIDFSDRPRIKLSAANLAFVAVGLLASAVGVAPFLIDSTQFGPTATVDAAREMATFAADGRTSVFGPDGKIDFICHRRIGLVKDCDSLFDPFVLFLFVAMAAAPTFLLVRHIKSCGKSGSVIPFVVGVAAVSWFVVAAIFAFKLHVPNRFILRVTPAAVALPYGLLVGEAVRNGLAFAFSNGTRRRIEIIAMLIGLIGYLAIVAGQSHRYFATWNNPNLAAAIADLPVGTTVAGFVKDADFVPIMAKRQVLFSRELSVALHLGYYQQIEIRMRDMLDVQWTPDMAVLTEKLGRHPVDIFMITAEGLSKRVLGGRFEGMLGNFVERKRAEFGDAPTALSRLAPNCQRGTFDGIQLLDAQCLIATAKQ